MSGFDFSFDDLGIDLDSEEYKDSESRLYDVIPLVFRGENNNYNEVIYVTNAINTASIFNQELDLFSSYEYFILPEGLELKNEQVLSKFEFLDEVQLTEEEIRASDIQTFNNQYLRAMLEN